MRDSLPSRDKLLAADYRTAYFLGHSLGHSLARLRAVCARCGEYREWLEWLVGWR